MNQKYTTTELIFEGEFRMFTCSLVHTLACSHAHLFTHICSHFQMFERLAVHMFGRSNAFISVKACLCSSNQVIFRFLALSELRILRCFWYFFLVNFQAEVVQGFACIVETLNMTVCVSRKNDEVVNVCKEIVSHVCGDVSI